MSGRVNGRRARQRVETISDHLGSRKGGDAKELRAIARTGLVGDWKKYDSLLGIGGSADSGWLDIHRNGSHRELPGVEWYTVKIGLYSTYSAVEMPSEKIVPHVIDLNKKKRNNDHAAFIRMYCD